MLTSLVVHPVCRSNARVVEIREQGVLPFCPGSSPKNQGSATIANWCNVLDTVPDDRSSIFLTERNVPIMGV